MSVVLLDWSVRESFHTLDYLSHQAAERDDYEVVWIEYYDRAAQPIVDRVDQAERAGRPCPVDRWIVMDMPRSAYYHKHLMYNVGLLVSRGDLIVICDSDAMMRPTFIGAILAAFSEDPDIVLHLDEVRSASRAYYPFSAPSFAEIEESAGNWRDGATTGIRATRDRLHLLNYGACFCGRREDLLRIGGADESIDYLGHVCGPYELTWRLANLGRREVWHPTEFLYHTWHPGTDGDENYLGPHDGRNVSTTALEARRSGRLMPLVENPAVRLVRGGTPPPDRIEQLVDLAVGDRDVGAWVIDDVKRRTSAGRAALGRGDYATTLRLWEGLEADLLVSPPSACDLGKARYHVRDYGGALAAFDAALDRDPDNPFARRGRGWTLYQQQRVDEAIRDFTRALAADPMDETGAQEARRGRGWALMQRGTSEEALADFDAVAATAAEEDADALQEAHRGRGWCLLRLKRPSEAVQAFEAALQYTHADGPARDDAQNGLRAAHAARVEPRAEPDPPVASRTAEPIKPASRGRTPSEVRASLLSALGWAHLDWSNIADAARAFGESLDLHAGNLDAQCGQARIRFVQDRAGSIDNVNRILACARSACDPVLTARALRARGWMHIQQREFDRAVDDFSEALAALPVDDQAARESALTGRAFAHYRAGRLAQARLDAAARRGCLTISRGRLWMEMRRIQRNLAQRLDRD